MEKIENLYALAIKHNLNFTYNRRANGSIAVTVISDKSDIVFSALEHPEGFSWFMVNGKRYDRIEFAIIDFEDLLLLHGE